MLIYGTHGMIHLSIGTPNRWLRWSIINFTVTGLLFLVALPWGPVGIATAWTASVLDPHSSRVLVRRKREFGGHGSSYYYLEVSSCLSDRWLRMRFDAASDAFDDGGAGLGGCSGSDRHDVDHVRSPVRRCRHSFARRMCTFS